MSDHIPIERRQFIKTAGGVAGVTALSVPVSAQSEKQYYLEHGDTCWEVEPLSYQNQSIRQYYNYYSVHAHPSTDILESDTSHLFLYEGPRRWGGSTILTLVAIHDIPSHDDHGSDFDTGGGAVTFEFSGLPNGYWRVQDDSGDTYSQTQADWTWATRNTDGGAYGDLGEGFDLTITPRFNEEATQDPLEPGEISFWCFLSGDATDPNEVLLDMQTDVRLVHAEEPPCPDPITDLPDECVREVNVDIKPCSDPNAINPDSNGVIPVGIQGTSDFDPVTEVEVPSLRFGAIGHVEAEPAHHGHRDDTIPCEGDGIDDLVVHFPVEDTGFQQGDDLGKLTGALHDGTAIIGFDTVKIVGGGNGAGNNSNSSGNSGGNGGGA